MTAYRTIRSKIVKSGTLVEGHAKGPWRKFDMDWPKGDTKETVETTNFEQTYLLPCLT